MDWGGSAKPVNKRSDVITIGDRQLVGLAPRAGSS
jgi:hypothetical protein